MAFFKFYVFIIALRLLRAVICGTRKGKTDKNINWYEVIGEFIAQLIVIYLSYHLLIYAGPDFIEFIKGVI